MKHACYEKSYMLLAATKCATSQMDEKKTIFPQEHIQKNTYVVQLALYWKASMKSEIPSDPIPFRIKQKLCVSN